MNSARSTIAKRAPEGDRDRAVAKAARPGLLSPVVAVIRATSIAQTVDFVKHVGRTRVPVFGQNMHNCPTEIAQEPRTHHVAFKELRLPVIRPAVDENAQAIIEIA